MPDLYRLKARKAALEAVQAKGHRTRQIILDAAEQLFGATDYDSISLRSVADQAGVLLGMVSYHFKNKSALFEAVLARRADEMNHIRLEELKRYKKPSVEQILAAFIRPVLMRNREPGWNSYIRVMSQVYYQERWRPMHRSLFQSFGEKVLDAFQRALPKTPRDILRQATEYSVMVLLGVSVLKFADKESHVSDSQVETVLTFLAGGFRAL